jgi:hypothetical protein
MGGPYSPMNAKEIIELYFVENRARILDIASFMDRIDRYEGAEEAKDDFRYKALIEALRLASGKEGDRTKALQMLFSDLSTEPLESAVGLKAVGAWEGAFHEGD